MRISLKRKIIFNLAESDSFGLLTIQLIKKIYFEYICLKKLQILSNKRLKSK